MSLLTITGSIADNHPQFDLLTIHFDELLRKGFISLPLQHLQLYYLGDKIRVNEWFGRNTPNKKRVAYVVITYCAYKGTLTENLTTSLFTFYLI